MALQKLAEKLQKVTTEVPMMKEDQVFEQHQIDENKRFNRVLLTVNIIPAVGEAVFVIPW